MIRIIDRVLSASGTEVRTEQLPLVFDSRREAVTFLNGFLQRQFTTGRSGYKLEQDYWWGCAADFELHCYRIEETLSANVERAVH